MQLSNYFISTLKEIPSEAELPSHRLMLKAGLIRKISTGLYSWLPLGLRVLNKVEAIIREEMNQAGAIELLMPTVQPAELWKESGRWEVYGKELLRFKDRHQRDFCYGPTHEEIITDIVKKEISSYKQLPVNFYQIQTKFRDEVRPRFGVMRSREFIMKDAYSFHQDKASLQLTYQKMYQAYSNIFTRLGLDFRAVVADTGNIGGSASHEFQVLAASGEDTIVYSSESTYSANLELAASVRSDKAHVMPKQKLTKIHTPNIKTITELTDFLGCDIKQTIKSIVVEGETEDLILLLLRGDYELNEVKASKLPGVKEPLTFASNQEINNVFNASGGSLGPVGFEGQIYADFSIEKEADWIVGANQDDYHYTGFNFARDAKQPEFVDLRNVVAGDVSPDGKGVLKLLKGIEVGHIFAIGSEKYAQPMNATFLDKNGHSQFFEMGCYGIGVTRIVAAAIEQNYDDKGIIWTDTMAPFAVIIVPLNYHKSQMVKEATDALYQNLLQQNIEVLLDDRDERAGVLLADSELIGIPHRIVIGDRGLKEGILEYQHRQDVVAEKIASNEIVSFLLNRLRVNSLNVKK